MSISQIKLNLELAILKAKGDQAKIDAAKQAAALATAAAEAEERAHRKQELDSQARAEEQIYKARLRVQLATARLQSVPTLDATQSAEKYLQVQYSIRQAQGEIAAAQIEYNAALKTLKTAQLYGSPMDIFEATAAVEVAALKVQEAGINFNTSLREGALNLAKNVIESAKQFRDSIRAYRDLQQANLRFLPVAQRRQVIEEAKSQGLAEAQRRGVALRNVEDLFNFNKFIEQDAALRQNMLDAQQIGRAHV